MKHLFLAFCLLSIGSLHAIDNNVELIANASFSTNVTPITSVTYDATPGVWLAGNNGLSTWNTISGFIADASTGAFVTSNGNASPAIFDNFLSQITAEATVNTGRYHFSISASGNQPFYIKISSAASATVLGTELTYSLKNMSSPAIEKQASPDYSGYSLKITPTASATTYSADLDLQNATPSSLRVFIVFPKVGNVTVDDISFMRTADLLLFTTYYVRPDGDNSSWSNLTGIDPDQIITSSTPDIVGTNTYYFAEGTYTKSGIAMTTGYLYGGFKGDETTINLSTRALSDKDNNGIIEPWEMTNEAIITGTNPISGTVSTNRLITVTGGEINGLTLQDQFSSSNGTIILGSVTTSPTALMDVIENAGKMINCTVKKIKSSTTAPVMTTNQFSLIDACLIEECISAGGTGATGAIFMNALGGKISNSVIRNNAAPNTGAYAGAIRTSSLSSTDENAIVENCVIYNNSSAGGGGAIRGQAQTGKLGIQIVNCTVVNNKTTTANTGSVDLITAGLIVNSIVIDDPKEEIRPNNSNNYISNNAIGTLFLAAGVTAYPNTDMVFGKAAADFNFNSYSTYVGSMQPGAGDFNQTTYDAIRASNFKITAIASAAVTTPGLKTLPGSYLIGGTGTSVALTATIPTTDITGMTRNTAYNFDLGAYQFSDTSTALSDNATPKSYIYASGNKIIILNSNNLTISVYSITGQLVKSIYATSDKSSVVLEKGIYIVKSGNQISKVIVK